MSELLTNFVIKE